MKWIGPIVLAGGLTLLASGLVAEPTKSGRLGNVPAKPTYAEHIAPILNRQCVECHRPDEVAPFSLIGYENAKKWAPMVAQTTTSRRMPPWKAVAGFGEFHDENRLTDAEIETIRKWATSGAPRGDKRHEPPVPVFSGEWVLGKPSWVLQPARPFRLAADGDDVYRNFVFDNPFGKDLWVKAIDVKPGNPRVVHHVIAFIDTSGRGKVLESQTKDGQLGYLSTGGGVGFIPAGTLGGWAPGVRPRFLPAGRAFRVPARSSLVVQIHYHPSGKVETDQTKIGLYFAEEPIDREMIIAWMLDTSLNIPPGEKEHRIKMSRRIRQDMLVYAVMPHMHLLGRKFEASVEFPDGTSKPLIRIDDWDFNWQLIYSLKQPMLIPAGSKIHIEGVYDNSAENPNQPSDPPKRVTWGEGTYDEMFLLVLLHTKP